MREEGGIGRGVGEDLGEGRHWGGFLKVLNSGIAHRNWISMSFLYA